jgi:hypothetical protein
MARDCCQSAVQARRAERRETPSSGNNGLSSHGSRTNEAATAIAARMPLVTLLECEAPMGVTPVCRIDDGSERSATGRPPLIEEVAMRHTVGPAMPGDRAHQ